MASRKLNVLVYNGTGTTIESVKHAIYSLRRLLSPNYAVIPVTETALLKEPWAPSCALLVIPGGADLGYCRVLNGEGNSIISQYVRRGGRYLGFCAGAYYGSKKCEFEVGNRPMEVVGSRELAFFPGTCRGAAFRGFQYNSERGAKAVQLNVRKAAFKGVGLVPEVVVSYYNGGGVFVDADDQHNDVEVLASYGDKLDVNGGTENAAVVYCRVGQGAAVLTGPHPEFASANLAPHPDIDGYADLMNSIKKHEPDRISFLKACLTKLGLEVYQESSGSLSPSHLHLSSMVSSDVNDLLCSWEEIMSKEEGEEYIRAENDTFHLEKPETRWSMGSLKDTLPSNDTTGTLTNSSSSTDEALIDYKTIVKHIVAHDRAWPDVKETPYFNHHAYYSSLRDYRQTDANAENWGDYLIYGEVVTSTNTILDKNLKLLAKLPSGFTVTATSQLEGRGRGNNVWVSPAGCLVMSTVINHPGHLAASRPVVFIQYLAAVAIVQAVKSYDKGYEQLPVKLKWPNDIYVRDLSNSSSPPTYIKIGGILSNCVYDAGSYQVVLGIGLNTTNGRPTTSLDALLPPHLPPFRIEKLVARILTRLESLYDIFIRNGFKGELERAYYENWLHGRQIVTLEPHGGAKARIVGITTDWGMLRVEELGIDDRPTGKMWALQSDENSFDFFRGLVKRKI
ncbi:class II aaRS and biotin synthetase [Xylaria nigripes]|nr:class II aaRS and biotin synthetase [Xylaria nigripes]